MAGTFSLSEPTIDPSLYATPLVQSRGGTRCRSAEAQTEGVCPAHCPSHLRSRRCPSKGGGTGEGPNPPPASGGGDGASRRTSPGPCAARCHPPAAASGPPGGPDGVPWPPAPSELVRHGGHAGPGGGVPLCPGDSPRGLCDGALRGGGGGGAGERRGTCCPAPPPPIRDAGPVPHGPLPSRCIGGGGGTARPHCHTEGPGGGGGSCAYRRGAVGVLPHGRPHVSFSVTRRCLGTCQPRRFLRFCADRPPRARAIAQASARVHRREGGADWPLGGGGGRWGRSDECSRGRALWEAHVGRCGEALL